MGRSYRQCTECGKRALSIATRCPGCGRELTAPPVRETGGGLELGRLITPNLIVGILAVVVILAVAVLGRSGRRAGERPVFTADSARGSAEVGFSSTGGAALDSASASEMLVARTWTHVRKTRRVTGDVEAVLLPGDTVVADSLSRGWYRVALEGQVLGYAHRSTLAEPQADEVR